MLLHSPYVPTKPLEPDYLKSPTQYGLSNQAEAPCHPISVLQGNAAWASETFICALHAEAFQSYKRQFLRNNVATLLQDNALDYVQPGNLVVATHKDVEACNLDQTSWCNSTKCMLRHC